MSAFQNRCQECLGKCQAGHQSTFRNGRKMGQWLLARALMSKTWMRAKMWMRAQIMVQKTAVATYDMGTWEEPPWWARTPSLTCRNLTMFSLGFASFFSVGAWLNNSAGSTLSHLLYFPGNNIQRHESHVTAHGCHN